MFHTNFTQCPVGLLLLRSDGDQEYSVMAKPVVYRPVSFTLDLDDIQKKENN